MSPTRLILASSTNGSTRPRPVHSQKPTSKSVIRSPHRRTTMPVGCHVTPNHDRLARNPSDLIDLGNGRADAFSRRQAPKTGQNSGLEMEPCPWAQPHNGREECTLKAFDTGLHRSDTLLIEFCDVGHPSLSWTIHFVYLICGQGGFRRKNGSQGEGYMVHPGSQNLHGPWWKFFDQS